MNPTLRAALILLAVAVAGGVALLYSGLYNIAATAPHSALFKEMVEIMVERSVARHAQGIEVPANFEALAPEPGFEHYDQMCVGCHGAPGVDAMEITQQMNPKPPELAKEVEEWTTAQLYWIITHGLKMTGMPGIRELDGKEERWQLTAFVRQLPQLTADDYQALKAAVTAPGEHHSH